MLISKMETAEPDITVTIPLTIRGQSTVVNIDAVVLVVEDNKVNVVIVTKLLAKMGYHFDVAENGLQAVEMTKSKRYDAILMDVQMPIMDGIEATRRIRMFDEDIPIIGVTANATFQECVDVGMNDNIMKPINFDFMRELLERYIQGVAV